MTFDVAIVGGGPAGLAVAIEARLRGLSALVLERRTGPVDKACGEGLLPAGLVALDRLGVLGLLSRDETAPFRRIAWFQEDGRSVSGPLPPPGGLGVRRLALSRALLERSRAIGAQVEEGCRLRAHAIDRDGVTLVTSAGEVRARLLVAADGLHSALRRTEGLECSTAAPRRFGLRRHVRCAPWSDAVEVHFASGAEAYVTPAGRRRVGLAFLFEPESLSGAPSFESLLARFPLLAGRIRDSSWDSETRGAGPFRQAVSRRVKDRFVLVGDAAGYVDAISGEGLTLAFRSAEALGRVLPDALERGASRASLEPYEREASRLFRRYERLAALLVQVARRPSLRRVVVDRLAARPAIFEWALALATR